MSNKSAESLPIVVTTSNKPEGLWVLNKASECCILVHFLFFIKSAVYCLPLNDCFGRADQECGSTLYVGLIGIVQNLIQKRVRIGLPF